MKATLMQISIKHDPKNGAQWAEIKLRAPLCLPLVPILAAVGQPIETTLTPLQKPLFQITDTGNAVNTETGEAHPVELQSFTP